MTAVGYQSLQHEVAIAESALCLAPSACQRGGKLALAMHHAHAASAATGHGFDQQRIAQAISLLGQLLIAGIVFEEARCAGHACREHVALGRGLVAHGLDGLGRRSDEDHARRATCLGETCVFTEKAVTRMHGVGTGAAGDIEQGVDAQVGLAGGSRRRVAPPRPPCPHAAPWRRRR